MANHTPVIIGVGEIKNPSRRMEDAIEPLDLMIRAINAAAHDAAGGETTDLLAQIDAVSVVASSTWPYDDLPGLVAERLSIQPSYTAYSELTGNSSVQLVDSTARLIAQGRAKFGVIVGGEAFASCTDMYLPFIMPFANISPLFPVRCSENIYQEQSVSTTLDTSERE